MYAVSSWTSKRERAKRKGQSSQETWTGKLATCTEEHHWSSSRSSKRNLTENPPFCTWSFPARPESSEMDLWSALSWIQETSTLSSFFPPAAPPCWGTEASRLLSAWTQPRYPEARALTALRRESSRQLGTQPRLKAESCARGSEGALAPPAGRRSRAGSPALTQPRGLPQKQLCGERSDWKPKPKWSRTAPPPSSKQ